MKIVFLGTGVYVLPILEVLDSDFEVSLVLTTEKSDAESVSKFCKENNIECISVKKITGDIVSKIKNSDAEVAVLANFGIILPQQILDLFPKGIINIHPSLLPKYRGSTPVQSAILNGDTKTGVSVMKLDIAMDHGPILAQKEEEILPKDTSEILYARLFNIGAQLLAKTLPKYLSSELKPTEQDHSKATFTKTLARDSGLIDINNSPSKIDIGNMVRAYSPWPGVWFNTKLSGKEKRIMLLHDSKIQVEGKKEMSYKDFLNGYKEAKNILKNL